MSKLIRPSCWHQNFVPCGLSAPAPGLYTCIKSWKKCIKSDFKDIFLKLATNELNENILVDIKMLSPGGCLPLPRGYIHVQNHEKKKSIKSDFKEIFLNLQQMTKMTRCSFWHKNFVPKGLSAPALGLYTCIKSWKKLYKIRLREIFF